METDSIQDWNIFTDPTGVVKHSRTHAYTAVHTGWLSALVKESCALCILYLCSVFVCFVCLHDVCHISLNGAVHLFCVYVSVVDCICVRPFIYICLCVPTLCWIREEGRNEVYETLKLSFSIS